MKEATVQFYNKHYKNMLILPAIVIVLAIAIIAHTYFTTGDFIHRDISLTGGTTITVQSTLSPSEAQSALSPQFPGIEVRSLSDNSGEQTNLVFLTSAAPEEIQPALEKYLGYKLDNNNSSIEFTGSGLSQDFYKQLLVAVVIAFFWMAAVVFIIFAQKWKVKVWAIVLNILFGLFLGRFMVLLPSAVSAIIILAFVVAIVSLYIFYSIPSFAVMSCAFADITMTLAVVDIMGMTLSSAGIVAFLMLIGYSVDTDILLTTRVLRRKNASINHEIFSSFKTGTTMTLTALAAVAVALLFVFRFQTSLNQIFIILLIGLFFDIFNTWITNTSLIKWFVERNKSAQ